VGNKAEQDFDPPAWLDSAPLWMKRLYLAALFGAELTAPSTITGHPHNFNGQVMSMNKRPWRAESGRRYLQRIRDWLREFGIDSVMLAEREERSGTSVAVRLRLMISGTPDNLIRLWTRVGFEYNRRKQHLGCVAAQYLRLKGIVVEDRRQTAALARDMRDEGHSTRTITYALLSRYMKPSFIEHALYSKRRHARIGGAFMSFDAFLKEKTEGLGETGRVWDRVVHVLPAPYDGPVFDFTVRDPSHTFIADGFVVSNCGVRLIRTDLDESQVRERLQSLVDGLFYAVPSGVGATGRLKLDGQAMDGVLRQGARWAVQQGYGWAGDLESMESGGTLPAADPDAVSPEAKKRGRAQIGTLGSGNHFLEVQVIDEIYDAPAAAAMGLTHTGQVVVFIHCGSRGLGHQVCTDYLRVAERSAREHGIHLVDRQLACMPFQSDEGRRYVGAMSAAANFAWGNRQVITHWVRGAFERVFAQSAEALGMSLVYDVSHNIAKIEEYVVDGRLRPLVVHRKGATRAFPAGHPDVPERYRAIGQPVLIPGDMGRYSFIALGTDQAVRESFGSTCHGAGRVMGRKQAVRTLAGRDIADELRRRGIIVRAQDRGLLAEEASQAYKDVADVVEVCHQAGLSRRVVRTRPIGVVKG
jgi:tRNA-splicing ligase RtcB